MPVMRYHFMTSPCFHSPASRAWVQSSEWACRFRSLPQYTAILNRTCTYSSQMRISVRRWSEKKIWRKRESMYMKLYFNYKYFFSISVGKNCNMVFRFRHLHQCVQLHIALRLQALLWLFCNTYTISNIHNMTLLRPKGGDALYMECRSFTPRFCLSTMG